MILNGIYNKGNMKKQIIIYADMEGASDIFNRNSSAVIHGSPLWREYGKKCITSDVLAVCQAANECKINEILIYDGHFAGEPEYNIIIRMCAYNFCGLKYIANIGCEASMAEAGEISQKVT